MQHRNRIIAEYALKDMKKPIGITEYKLTESIPQKLKGSLPSIEDLEQELEPRSKNIKKQGFINKERSKSTTKPITVHKKVARQKN
jgi:hypothetical protein